MRKETFVILAAAGLAGCYQTTSSQQASVTPTKPLVSVIEARRTVAAERARIWKDSESIRDAAAGETHFCAHELPGQGGAFMTKLQASCMCIEANAKNAYGGYVGIKRTIAVFPETGQFDTMDGGIKGYSEYCQNLTPFPEINGGYTAPPGQRRSPRPPA